MQPIYRIGTIQGRLNALQNQFRVIKVERTPATRTMKVHIDYIGKPANKWLYWTQASRDRYYAKKGIAFSELVAEIAPYIRPKLNDYKIIFAG